MIYTSKPQLCTCIQDVYICPSVLKKAKSMFSKHKTIWCSSKPRMAMKSLTYHKTLLYRYSEHSHMYIHALHPSVQLYTVNTPIHVPIHYILVYSYIQWTLPYMSPYTTSYFTVIYSEHSHTCPHTLHPSVHLSSEHSHTCSHTLHHSVQLYTVNIPIHVPIHYIIVYSYIQGTFPYMSL